MTPSRLAVLLLLAAAGVLLARGLFVDDADEAVAPVEHADEAPRAGDVRLEGRGARATPEGEATSAAGEAPATKKVGSLTLHVVAQASRRPVPGARVVVRDRDGEGAVLLEGTTDAAGRIAWIDHEPTFGLVLVEAEGLARVQTFFSLWADKTREEEIVLPPAVTLRGVVVDGATDRPVVGARVRLLAIDVPGFSKDPYFRVGDEWDRTRTDAAGAFAFEGCAREQRACYHGFVVTASGYAPVTKVAFDTDELLEGRGAVTALPPAGRVEGRLLGTDGKGIEGVVWAAPAHLAHLLGRRPATCVLADGRPPWSGWGDDPEGLEDLYGTWQVETDAEGRFAFEDLPLAEPIAFEGRVGEVRTERRSLLVTADTPALTLEVPASGRIVVVVRGPDGKPSPRAYVKWVRQPSVDSIYVELQRADRRTDEAGRAVFEHLTPGPFGVSIWGNGLQQAVQHGVLEPNASLTLEFDAQAESRPTADVPARLPIGDPFGSEPTVEAPPPVTVRVVIELPPEAPLPKGYVLHCGSSRFGNSGSGPWPEDGRRRLEIDRVCEYGAPETVEAFVDGYLPLRWYVAPESRGLVVLETKPLDRGLSAHGRVKDDAGNAVEAASVTLETPGSDDDLYEFGTVARRAQTDTDGRFRLTALPAGAMELRVEVPWTVHTETVDVRAGMSALVVTLPQQAVVRGRVLDRDGLPVARENVTIRPADAGPDADPLWSGSTDRAGRFRAPITGGRFQVAVRRHLESRGWTTAASTDVELAGGAETAVTLTVDR